MWYLSGFCLLVSYLIFWNLKFSSWFPIKSGKIFRGNLAILEQFHEISHENHYSDFIYLIWKRAKAERSEREGTGRDRMQGRDGRVKSRGVRKWDNLMFKTSEINDVKSGYARRDIMKHNSRKNEERNLISRVVYGWKKVDWEEGASRDTYLFVSDCWWSALWVFN